MTAQPMHTNTQGSNVSQLPVNPSIPNFEGAPVSSATMKIVGRSEIEDTEGVVITTDDRVRLVGEYRVTGVRHYVDKNGELVREQTLKPLSVTLCPYDPSDPSDDGIVRARKRP